MSGDDKCEITLSIKNWEYKLDSANQKSDIIEKLNC